MLQGTRPITVVATLVAVGTLTSLGLQFAGKRTASLVVLGCTALIAFSPLLLLVGLQLFAMMTRRR